MANPYIGNSPTRRSVNYSDQLADGIVTTAKASLSQLLLRYAGGSINNAPIGAIDCYQQRVLSQVSHCNVRNFRGYFLMPQSGFTPIQLIS